MSGSSIKLKAFLTMRVTFNNKDICVSNNNKANVEILSKFRNFYRYFCKTGFWNTSFKNVKIEIIN